MIGQLRRRSGGAHGGGSIPKYLCFTASEDNSTITRDGTYAANLEYSSDGNTWSTFDDTVTITLNTNDSVYFRGTNNRLATSTSDYTRFVMTGKIAASGNTMSLLYGDTFEGQLALPNYTYTFYYLFNNCSALRIAPELPATTLRANCYRSMFEGCSNLTDAPSILPATSIPNIGRVYDSMFKNCSSLVNPPRILLTTDGTTNSFAMYSMFENCISLVTAPELLLTTVKYNTCQRMYYGCTSLRTAPPHIYVTSLSYNSFTEMFYGCTSLVTPPIIHATSLGQLSFSSMFRNCTSLTTAPTLLPTTIVNSAYTYLFNGASQLNYIKMLGIDGISTNNMRDWVKNVASTGIFVKHIDAQWTTTGNHGVPTNWTVIYYDPALDKYYTDQTRSQECDDHGNPI